jgi:thioredoxin reductase
VSAEEKDSDMEKVDVAIVGGGPAGMQAALVIARTRKKVIVLDAPRASRNAASNGVHNFLGLDGVLPGEIRKIAWKQIDVYSSAELREEQVDDIRRSDDDRFLLTGARGGQIAASKVVLAFGYHDIFPDVPGFIECWSETIIPCPFCDGYENRDRVWGIVPGEESELEVFPKMARNWTSTIKVFLADGIEMDSGYRDELSLSGISVYDGSIVEAHHTAGKVEAVTLDSGERVEVETLVWKPSERPSALIQNLVDNLGLELDDAGHVKTDAMQQTNVANVWAAGDIQGWVGGIGAAAAGDRAAVAIVKGWYSHSPLTPVRWTAP